MTRSSSQSLGVLLAGCMLLVAGIPSIATAFSSNPIDGWEQTAKITPDDADEPGPTGSPAHAFTTFGSSTAIDGDTLVVGTAPDQVDASGWAYVFQRNQGGEWTQTAKLTPNQPQANWTGFGRDVAVDEETGTIVVGNPGYHKPGEDHAGAVYIFQQNTVGEWVQTSRIVYPNPPIQSDPGPYFGEHVAVDEETLAVATPLDKVEGKEFAGRVYIYDRVGDEWLQSQTLKSSLVAERNHFGSSLAIDNARLAVGAQGETVGGIEGVGAAYVFTRENGTWTSPHRITAPDPGRTGPGAECFAFSIGIVDNTVVVGDPCWSYERNPAVYIRSTHFAGSAYVYREGSMGWMLDAQLFGSRVPQSIFGTSVAVDDTGDHLVIGARDGPTNDRRMGAGYIFEKDGSDWEKELVLGEDTGPRDQFGRSVSMSEGTIIIAAHHDDNRRDGTPWPLNDQPDLPGLGLSQGKDAGSVYVFERSQGPGVGATEDAPQLDVAPGHST